MVHVHCGKKSHVNTKRLLKPLNLNKTDVFLDAGCSDGYISIEAAKQCKKVYALDIHKESIEKLKSKNIPNIIPLVADITKPLPIKEKVDFCLLSNVLHGLVENNELIAIKNIKKILKGELIIVEFRKVVSVFGPSHSVKLSKDKIISILKKYNFRKVKDYNISLFHFALVFE
ncbi:class I SAM-dependent methyltransferase [Candidatus Woesearchaeota archaeon]|nr:class I SAM-dependent methyltransferase [Candidatus Woesearchaeota archaeon]